MRNILFAAVLAISPLTGALAQGTGTGSTTGSAATTDSSNPNQAGATGSTTVPGNKSSTAADDKATAETKQGHVSGGGK